MAFDSDRTLRRETLGTPLPGSRGSALLEPKGTTRPGVLIERFGAKRLESFWVSARFPGKRSISTEGEHAPWDSDRTL